MKNICICLSGYSFSLYNTIQYLNKYSSNELNIKLYIFSEYSEIYNKLKNSNVEKKVLSNWKKNRELNCNIINDLCIKEDIDLILLSFNYILCGKLLKNFSNKIINFHPAILPSFKGFNATKKAYYRGCKYIGCTSHFIDEKMDEGIYICQAIINVTNNDTYESLSKKKYLLWSILHINTILLFIRNKIIFTGTNLLKYKDVIYINPEINPLLDNLNLDRLKNIISYMCSPKYPLYGKNLNKYVNDKLLKKDIISKNNYNKLLRGDIVSKNIYNKLVTKINVLKNKNIIPKIEVIIIGNRQDSNLYVKLKKKKCDELGIICSVNKFKESVTEKNICELIDKFNVDDNVHTILVQLPLPTHFNTNKIINKISIFKDVDCLTDLNFGKIITNNNPIFYPCTAQACIEILDFYNIQIRGKIITIIGCSNLVGLPLSLLLLHRKCTPIICHTETPNIISLTKQADILITACGQTEMIKSEWIKKDCIIIDIGINKKIDLSKKKGYSIVGDVDFNNVINKVDKITPVPNGVGPMTICILMMNIIKSVFEINNINF